MKNAIIGFRLPDQVDAILDALAEDILGIARAAGCEDRGIAVLFRMLTEMAAVRFGRTGSATA